MTTTFADSWDPEETEPGVPPAPTPDPPKYTPPTERYSSDWDDAEPTLAGVAPAPTPEWVR